MAGWPLSGWSRSATSVMLAPLPDAGGAFKWAWARSSCPSACFLTLAAACSMEAAIEKLSSPEDRAFAHALRRQCPAAAMRRRSSPSSIPSSGRRAATQLAQARPLFPPGEGSTRLIGYHVATNVTNGASSTRKEYILVTTDADPLDPHPHRDPSPRAGRPRVVEWNVKRLQASRRPSFEMYRDDGPDRALASGRRCSISWSAGSRSSGGWCAARAGAAAARP